MKEFNKENSSIRFTETHLFDIKATLGKIGISGTAIPLENRKKEPEIIHKKSKKSVEYTFCPICNVKVRKDRKNRHLKKVHQKTLNSNERYVGKLAWKVPFKHICSFHF